MEREEQLATEWDLLADIDTICCICHFAYKPGQKITVYRPCNHPIHAHCYNVLRRSNLKRRCHMGNLKQRRIVRFTIDLSIVDQRVLEEGDVQEELLAIQEMQALVVEPLCCFCYKKKMADKVAFRICYRCRSVYRIFCSWEAIRVRRYYGCGAEVKSVADFVGRLRFGGPGEGVGNDSTSSSGLDLDVAVVEAPIVGAPDNLDME